MPGGVKLGRHRVAALLAALCGGALAYAFMPSCSNLVDADDTLCHAIAAQKDGVVDWPDEPSEFWRMPRGADAFDSVMSCPWWPSQEARDYIAGYGLAQGHNWDDLGRADMMTYNQETSCLDTPLARAYNGYSNIVYANFEGIDLDRGRALDDFEYYDTFLKWTSAYLAQRTFRINGNCARRCWIEHRGSCVIARTFNGAFRNDYIDLYQTFFYDIDAVYRSSTLVHEVRHARDGVDHDGGSGCSRGSACDRRWSLAGSNTYEQIWLAAYYWAPEGNAFITDARRARAGALFGTLQQIAFNDPVQWGLRRFELVNEIPEFYVEQVACSDDPKSPHYCLILAN